MPTLPKVSFEELLPAENLSEPQEVLPGEPRGLPLMSRIAMVALAVLAAAVAVVILWPGVSRRQPVSPRIVESFPAPTPTVPQADLAAALRTPATPTALIAANPPAPPPPAATETPAPAATPRPRRPAPAEADGGVETMRSPDWAGHEPVFVVHFSSYRSRGNATSDAARLARELGRPAHAVTVDLGEKGTWYRVVVGEFATAGEARDFRTEIAVRRPGEVSGVYRLSAP
jgi:hypothetical protein